MKGNGFKALRVEGGLLPTEYLLSVARLQAPQQSGADYDLSKSLNIRDELDRYWSITKDLYDAYLQCRQRRDLSSTQVGIDRWLIPLMRDHLGYKDLASSSTVIVDEREFKFSHQACDGVVPMLLVTNEFELDKASTDFGFDGRQIAPHRMVQEYLNAANSVLWGVVSNGSKIRILRDNASLVRPTYIEVDLDLIFSEQLVHEFRAFWLMTHATRLQPHDDKPSKCIFENWRSEALETGERVRENLRNGVTEALRQLGTGFLQHPENAVLRRCLEKGELTKEWYFLQLLRLVYRLLFLFTVEDRELLHMPETSKEQREVYLEGYSVTRLRERSFERRHYDHNSDLWSGLTITFGALHEGETALGLPPLGGLFDPDQCRELDDSLIANEHLLEAVRQLGYFQTRTTLARVNYRDMDTEELGSVYESLLELQPSIDVNGTSWKFSFVQDQTDQILKGSERKLTGSYYTPPDLVGELIKSTLDKVIEQTKKRHPEDPRAAILNLKVVDPACGSGHFLLAAARRLADEVALLDPDSDLSDEAKRQHDLREVVMHCIYGVDRNPLAVELCKTALWIETVEPGKPLTFLDSHILVGDSLMGVLNPKIIKDIPSEAYKPLTGDDKTICTELKVRNRQSEQYDLFDQTPRKEVAEANENIVSMPEDTLLDIQLKRSMWRTTIRDELRAKEVLKANLFVSSWFAPKTRNKADLVPLTQDLNRLQDEREQRKGVEEFVQELADTHRFFHWHITFAEIMQKGGFDVVLGNPPWERMKLQELEFFSSRSHSIAGARNKAERERLIRDLINTSAQVSDRALHAEFHVAKRGAEARSQFLRTCGRYPMTGVGDVNTYSVFAETFLNLVNSRGRAGVIVPTGIAADHSTRAFFEHIVSEKKLVSLYDFENRGGLFPGVDSRYKFCLLTMSGQQSPNTKAEFAFYLHQTYQLKETERRFTLSMEDLLTFNPNTRTCPIFRSNRDMGIAFKMYKRAGVFVKEKSETQPEENPWGARFMSMFHMANDSHLFKTRSELEESGWYLEGNVFVRDEERYVPLYEAKLFHQYDHRFATFDGVAEQEARRGKTRTVTVGEKADPLTSVLPRYWVKQEEVAKRLGRVQDRTGQDRTGQDRTGQDRTGQDRTGIISKLTELAQSSLFEKLHGQPTRGH